MKRLKSVLGFVTFLKDESDFQKLAKEVIAKHNALLDDAIHDSQEKLIGYSEMRPEDLTVQESSFVHDLEKTIKELNDSKVNAEEANYLLHSTQSGLQSFIIII